MTQIYIVSLQSNQYLRDTLRHEDSFCSIRKRQMRPLAHQRLAKRDYAVCCSAGLRFSGFALRAAFKNLVIEFDM